MLYYFYREKDEITEADREAGRYYLEKYLDGQVPKAAGDLKRLGDLITRFYLVL